MTRSRAWSITPTAVLPFGGRHPQALANLEGGVPPRLAKNLRLNRELLGSTKPAWIRQDGGIYQPTRVVEFDGKKLEGLLKYIGRGLAWHHWKVYLRLGDEAIVMLMPDMSSAIFQSLVSQMRPENKVVGKLGPRAGPTSCLRDPGVGIAAFATPVLRL
jgi:hypothetical protein